MSREKQIEEMANSLEVVGCPNGHINFYKTAEKLHAKGYRKSTEVAEEIFGEIERIIIKHLNDAIKSKSVTTELTIDYMELDIAELKKKYTEGGE